MEQDLSERTYDGSPGPSMPPATPPARGICEARSGGTAMAPAISGCHISGSVNISVSSTGPGPVLPSPNSANSHAAAVPPAHLHCEADEGRLLKTAATIKSILRDRFRHCLQGVMAGGNKLLLNKIYTELYITQGGRGEVNHEHEVRRIEAASRTMTQETPIKCNDIFVLLPGQDSPPRTVVTRGVAGIGKTVSVNKFILDWAEERANQQLELVLPLSFREMNLMSKRVLSLSQLLVVTFPEIKELHISAKNTVLIILDGLDESRFSLDFDNYDIVYDDAQPATVDVLVTNLIRGSLLPSAHVWVTSRPAGVDQIPLDYIDLVTEVRGFTNPQKEEYFRKLISDESLANTIIKHVTSSRTLHIMCHIPIFCRMAAAVLEKRLLATDSRGTPKTLTQMYIHFLGSQMDSDTDATRNCIISLGKLAFKELEKGHLIFYEKDLIANGVDVAQLRLLSGLYTQIFNDELTPCKSKVFSFVHLSVQEFFAALYVFLTFNNDNINVLVRKSSISRFRIRDSSALILYKAAVDKALVCERGHFDIFLRFLLGLSLESNQDMLGDLMTKKNSTKSQTRPEIIKHIKEKIRASPSPDRCINLFHCLNELNDRSLMEEIQSFLTAGSLIKTRLSPAQWATLNFVLLTSEEDLGLFELSKYAKSEEGLLRLLPVIKASKIAHLQGCNLTENCCESLAAGISLSQIREIDLSENNLTDAGLTLLSAGLMQQCTLETLSLKHCRLTERSCGDIALVISSNSSQLRKLDLSDNDLQDLGVQRLSEGLARTQCKLEILIVSQGGCAFLASALNSNPSGLKELDLSFNHPEELGLRLLSTLLEDSRCSLDRLSVDQCGESRIQPEPKKYTTELTLDPHTAHRDLLLSEGNSKATRWTTQPHPDHPQRFDFWRQVLCREGLTGRCYWETQWSGRAHIGVAYRRMTRKGEGDDSWLGKNELSWSLGCTKDGYSAWHRGVNTPVKLKPSTTCSSNSNHRVGVFLDWPAGRLSFYEVSSSGGGAQPTLLHSFQDTFTEPLYPGFRLGWVASTVVLC